MGSVFVLACATGDNGYEVLKYNSDKNEWTDQLGSGEQLAVYIDALPITIGKDGNLYKKDSTGKWDNYGGCFGNDLAVGQDGNIWSFRCAN